MNRLVIAFALIACALALPSPDGGHHGGYGGGSHGGHHGGHKVVHGAHHGGHHGGNDYHKPAKYDFAYGVHDDYHGTNFGHSETRDGYKTSGQYYVQLPDGRLQKVTYYADEHGYHPTVTYEGKAHFPSHSGHKSGGYH